MGKVVISIKSTNRLVRRAKLDFPARFFVRGERGFNHINILHTIVVKVLTCGFRSWTVF